MHRRVIFIYLVTQFVVVGGTLKDGSRCGFLYFEPLMILGQLKCLCPKDYFSEGIWVHKQGGKNLNGFMDTWVTRCIKKQTSKGSKDNSIHEQGS